MNAKFDFPVKITKFGQFVFAPPDVSGTPVASGPDHRGAQKKLSEFCNFDLKIEFVIRKLVGIDTGVEGKSCSQ